MVEVIFPDDTGRLDVRFFPPPADLEPYLTLIYHLKVSLPPGETIEDYLQPEWANLRFYCGASAKRHGQVESSGPTRLGEARLHVTGPRARALHFETGSTEVWGVGLMPLGWARFVGVPASDYVDFAGDGEEDPAFAGFSPLCDVLCEPGEDEDEQLAALVGYFRNHPGRTSDEDRIRAIYEAMVDPYLVNIEDFADAAKMHKRTLERLCRKRFGFSPRFLLRRQRMTRCLMAFMLAKEKNWRQTIDLHYHDQSHFFREFQTFMGMSPSEYAALPHPILGAFAAERQRVWGAPVREVGALPGEQLSEA